MFGDIYRCITIEHDYRLILLAALICLFASYTTMNLLQRANEASQGARRHWSVLTAISAGCGVWATHFVAMIAYDPGMNMTFDVVMTLISVLLAIGIIGAGMALWVVFRALWVHVLAGTVIGLGISAMHAVGMIAVKLQGVLVYDQSFLVLGVFFAVAFSVASCLSMRNADRQQHLFRGAALFTIAICGLHFSAMTAVAVEYDPTVVVPSYAVPKVFIVLGVTMAAGLLLALTLASSLIDRHVARQFRFEVQRLRDLADAGLEGVVLLDEIGRILDANASFLALTGRRLDVLRGLSLKHCFRNMDMDNALERLAADGESVQDAVVIHADGSETSIGLQLVTGRKLEVAAAVAIVRSKSL